MDQRADTSPQDLEVNIARRSYHSQEDFDGEFKKLQAREEQKSIESLFL